MISRRTFLGSTTALALGGFSAAEALAQSQDLLLVNGRIHTMDAARRVVSQVLIQNGRFAAVGNNLPATLKGSPYSKVAGSPYIR
jgi:hypothetical protein